MTSFNGLKNKIGSSLILWFCLGNICCKDLFNTANTISSALNVCNFCSVVRKFSSEFVTNFPGFISTTAMNCFPLFFSKLHFAFALGQHGKIEVFLPVQDNVFMAFAHRLDK